MPTSDSGASSPGDGGPDGGADSGGPAVDGGAGGGPTVPLGPLDPATACHKGFGSQHDERIVSAAMDLHGDFTVVVPQNKVLVSSGGTPLTVTDVGLDFGGGPLIGDGFIASFSAGCVHRWSHLLDANANSRVAVGPAGEVWATTKTKHLVKHDHDGNVLTDITLPVMPTDIAVASDGGVFLQGSIVGTFDFGGGPLTATKGFYVVKLDANGAFVWNTAVEWNTATSGSVVGVRVAPNGDAIVGGLHQGLFDLGGAGTPLFAAPAGQYNGFLLRVNAASGTLAWGRAWNVGSSQVPISSFAVDGLGEIYIAGSSKTSSGAPYFAKHDATGAQVWNQSPAGAFMFPFTERVIGPMAARGVGAYVSVYQGATPSRYLSIIAVDHGGVAMLGSGSTMRAKSVYNMTFSLASADPKNVLSLAAAPDGRVVLGGLVNGNIQQPFTFGSKFSGKGKLGEDAGRTDDAFMVQVK